MKLTNLSWNPQKPCALLQWPDVTILLDCLVDFSPFLHYLPHVYQSSRLKGLPPVKYLNLPYVKELCGNIYIDGPPEVHIVSTSSLKMESVDCILVSNWDSLVALPFYTENTGFRGLVYATDPVLQFGRLLIEEFVEFFDRLPPNAVDNRWKKANICTEFTNPPNRNPDEWRKFYSKKDMETSLARIVPLSFNQEVTVFKTSITAVRSGHSIGSANWYISGDSQTIGYLTSSSIHSSHTRIADFKKFENCENLFLTSISHFPDDPPEMTVGALLRTTTETLKLGGNVLFPMSSVGIIFDLISQISKIIDTTNGIPADTPIYFISPNAKSALAYSNVNAEWLSEQRQQLVYTPEEPFSHSILIRNNRLRVFDSLFGAFSKEFKTPCVMFTSHASLRIGDAAHMIELWSADSKNAVILTDTEFSIEAYKPFELLEIRVYNYPIETRLDFQMLNENILQTIAPKILLVPSSYMLPMKPNRNDLMIQYGGKGSVIECKLGECVTVPATTVRKRKVKIHPELMATMKMRGAASSNRGYCHLAVNLSVFDDDYQLIPPVKKWSVRPKYTGEIDSAAIVSALAKKSYTAVCSNVDDEGTRVIRIEKLDATITISGRGTRTKIQASGENRPLLLDLITSVLKPLGAL
ncbi:unnamed protein product [Caenorhabditis auriculariae]|uniref:Beta-Casp domain-containing protein n=1 Tax=Caenorhabditis auriculariae TaxID=2777116 RepID=A0A8S1HD84_9PELO|nr:unnamed protein product [Caenorhabditis auriculariae]